MTVLCLSDLLVALEGLSPLQMAYKDDRGISKLYLNVRLHAQFVTEGEYHPISEYQIQQDVRYHQ